MKIRNGFVSNSSSSSFIVFSKDKIENFNQLYSLMWNDDNEQDIKNSYKFNSTGSYNSINMSFDDFKQKATNFILNEILEKEHDMLYILSNMDRNNWYDEKQKIYHIGDVEFKNLSEIREKIKEYKELQIAVDEYDFSKYSEDEYESLVEQRDDMWSYEYVSSVLDDIDEVFALNPNQHAYSFVFSDESGTFFSILEHYNVFGQLKTYIESHH